MYKVGYMGLGEEEKAFIKLDKTDLVRMANIFIRSKPKVANHLVLSFLSEYMVFISGMWKCLDKAKTGGITLEDNKNLIEEGEEFIITVLADPQEQMRNLSVGYYIDAKKPIVKYNPQYFYNAIPLDPDIEVEVLQSLLWIHVQFLKFYSRISNEKKISRFWKHNVDSFYSICPLVKVNNG